MKHSIYRSGTTQRYYHNPQKMFNRAECQNLNYGGTQENKFGNAEKKQNYKKIGWKRGVSSCSS